MIKKTVKYEDFNGNEVVEDLYFNYTKTELMKLQFNGTLDTINKAQETNDVNSMALFADDFVKNAYGIKSEDGKRFIKSKEIAEEFAQSLAYDALMNDLMFKEGEFDKFVRLVIPKDISSKIDTPEIQEKVKKMIQK